MYMVIRKFKGMRSVPEAARRAESGIGHMLRSEPGFRGYYVFDAGNGEAGSVTLFEDRLTAIEANDKAVAWLAASLADLIDGEPEITFGNVLVALTPAP